MRSILSKAALAATILTVSAAGVTAAFADEFSFGFRDHGGCGYQCRTHWAYPPLIVEPRGYVDFVPAPLPAVREVWPVYVNVPQNPQLRSIMSQVGADGRALDADRAAGRLPASDYWRLRGEAQAIRAEAAALDRRGSYVSGVRIAALQGEASRLTRAVDRIG